MSKRGIAFITALAGVLTVYLGITTAVLDDNAATPADQAVVTLLKVLSGAALLVTIGMLAALAKLDDEGADRERPSSE